MTNINSNTHETVSIKAAFGLPAEVSGFYDTEILRPKAEVAERNPLIPSPMLSFSMSPEKVRELLVHHKHGEPVHIYGPAGCGKTEGVRFLCASLRRPLVVFEANAETTTEDLFGRETLRAGEVVRLEGPLLLARRLGAVVLINEFDALKGHVQLALNGYLELSKPFMWAPKGAQMGDMGKMVGELRDWVYPPNPEHRVILTSNTGGKVERDGMYMHTNKTNASTRDRCVYVQYDYAAPEEELKILKAACKGLPGNDLPGVEVLYGEIIGFANAMRALYKTNKASSVFSVRGLIRWAKYTLDLRSMDEAFLMAIYPALEESDRQTALSIFESDFNRKVVVPPHLMPQG